MMKKLLENLRTRVAIREHQNSKPQPLQLTYSEAKTIRAFRDLGAQTNFQARLGQAAQLEAHQVLEQLVNILCDITARGQLNLDHIYRLEDEGIVINYGTPVIEKNVRLAKAVKRLAFIAGPGFTTDHLIDEGIVQEGDIS